MKALLILTLMLLAAATAVAYASPDFASSVAAVVAETSHTNEPATLLLSGSALIGLAGAVRRLTC